MTMDAQMPGHELQSQVVELRQYVLHPGERDVLINLFDREFVETQESHGMQVIGQFRDMDDPDRFVWLRGFPDMATRASGLAGFYGGPVWRRHRDVANATMVDSDDVLLLRPARPTSGFSRPARRRPPRESTGAGDGLVVASVYSVEPSGIDSAVDYFEREVEVSLINAGATILGYFVSDTSANNFPPLPIREGENVFVAIAGLPEATEDAVATTGRLFNGMAAAGAVQLQRVMTLAPTARSLLTGSSSACAAAQLAHARTPAS